MSFRNIFIVGAGAIGSCYGAFLSRRNDVTLIGSRAYVLAVKSHGLIIEGDLEGTFPVKAETQISSIPENSLVILTTKAHDTVRAATALRPALRHDTVLLALQNGLKIKDTIRRAVGGRGDTVRGVVMMAGESFEPGKIKLWDAPTIIENTGTGKKIQTLFRNSGLKTRLTSRIEEEEWRKLITNCVINPLTAILRVRNNEIAATHLKETRRTIVEECLLVAESEGVRLGNGLMTEIDQRIKGYSNYSSMYQDIAKGKKTEIAFLNGRIVELGREHRIGTPVNEALVDMVRFLEAGK